MTLVISSNHNNSMTLYAKPTLSTKGDPLEHPMLLVWLPHQEVKPHLPFPLPFSYCFPEVQLSTGWDLSSIN